MYVLIKDGKPFAATREKKHFAEAIKDEEVMDTVKIQPCMLPKNDEIVTIKYIGSFDNGEKIKGSFDVVKVCWYDNY